LLLASSGSAAVDTVATHRVPVAFIYGTRETLWTGIARALLAERGIISETVERCEAFIAARLGWSFKQTFSGDDDVPECRKVPALVTVQLALTAAWGERGLVPAAVVGRCGGEFAAGHAAGALPFEDALELACRISRLIEHGRGAGRMVMVHCRADDLARLQRSSPVAFSIISDSTDNDTVIACRPGDLLDVQTFLERHNVAFRVVASGIAPHTEAMEEWREEMTRPLSGLAADACTRAYYSAAAEGVLQAPPGLCHYWRVVREPVLVGRALQTALADGFTVFVEVGGRPSLHGMVLQQAALLGLEVIVLPTMRQNEPVTAVMDETEAALSPLRARRRS
jgi:[acyl-carrier-protein] S-malonyltransferase